VSFHLDFKNSRSHRDKHLVKISSSRFLKRAEFFNHTEAEIVPVGGATRNFLGPVVTPLSTSRWFSFRRQPALHVPNNWSYFQPVFMFFWISLFILSLFVLAEVESAATSSIHKYNNRVGWITSPNMWGNSIHHMNLSLDDTCLFMDNFALEHPHEDWLVASENPTKTNMDDYHSNGPGAPDAQLELATCAYVACSLSAWFFWRHKPYDIDRSSVIEPVMKKRHLQPAGRRISSFQQTRWPRALWTRPWAVLRISEQDL
jgi:hypothetical protein